MSLCPHGVRIEHQRCDRCEEIAHAENEMAVRVLRESVPYRERDVEALAARHDRLLSALKGLIENEDDVPSYGCPFREHWDKALEAIHEADPYWEHEE